MTDTLRQTTEAALETSEIVINIMSDKSLTDAEKKELIDAVLK